MWFYDIMDWAESKRENKQSFMFFFAKTPHSTKQIHSLVEYNIRLYTFNMTFTHRFLNCTNREEDEWFRNLYFKIKI